MIRADKKITSLSENISSFSMENVERNDAPQSPRHLIDNIVVVRCGFIVHAPTAVDEF